MADASRIDNPNIDESQMDPMKWANRVTKKRTKNSSCFGSRLGRGLLARGLLAILDQTRNLLFL